MVLVGPLMIIAAGLGRRFDRDRHRPANE